MDHYQYVINVIRCEREVRGISVAELARRADMGEEQLGCALRWRRVLKADELVRVCVVLGIPLEALVPPEMVDRAETARRATVRDYGQAIRGAARRLFAGGGRGTLAPVCLAPGGTRSAG